MRGTAFNVNRCGLRIPLTCPVTLQHTAGNAHAHAYMAEQPISLDGGANGVSPGAPSHCNAEGGGPVGDVLAIISPRTTLTSARDPEAEHKQRRSKPLRSNKTLWEFFMVFLKDSLPGIAVCKLREANGDFDDSKVRFGSSIYLRQHLDTERNGCREALKEHEVRGASSKGGAVTEPRARRNRGASLPTRTASNHSRSRGSGSSSTTLLIDGFGLTCGRRRQAFRARLGETLINE